MSLNNPDPIVTRLIYPTNAILAFVASIFFTFLGFNSSHIHAAGPGLSKEQEELMRREMEESGISEAAIDSIIDSTRDLQSEPEALRALGEAYGPNVPDSDLEIAAYFQKNPIYKHRVGFAAVDVALSKMELPLRLDEITLMVGVGYDPGIGALLYQFLLELDLSNMTAQELDDVQSEIEAQNTNYVCEVSLTILRQGFEMVYIYSDITDREIFRVVRTYAGCRSLGYL